MLDLYFSRTQNQLILETDDPTIQYLLESRQKKYEYIPYKKSWGYTEKVEKIYETKRGRKANTPIQKFHIGPGWAGYLLGVLGGQLNSQTYNKLLQDVVYAEFYRETAFPELRDYQNSDVLFLLKYKRGLMTVNTGYGKTQVIATLTNYAHQDLGKKVLLVCPSNKARDELVKRLTSVFGLTPSSRDKDLNGNLDCIITSGLMNSQKINESWFLDMLHNYEWVLVDEVEYTINAGGNFLYQNCLGAERFYAFSGTADKENGDMITFSAGLSDVVIRNKDLIKYFGPSLVYRKPLNMNVEYVTVKTRSLDKLNLNYSELPEDGSPYIEIMNQIWTDEEVALALVKTLKRFPCAFLPMNNLVRIISTWIEKYFKGIFRSLLVCGEGYLYYDLSGNCTKLSLQEACDYIRDGKVDVIPSTSAGYRALDFPGLENIVLIQGKIGGVVLQSIGRVARGKQMRIICFEPVSSRSIPIYTKAARERRKMVNDYYQYCNIQSITISEDEL